MDLKEIPHHVLLLEAAKYDGTHLYKHLATIATRLGYVVCTKADPLGRVVTTHDIRRQLQKARRSHHRFPHGRRPTKDDYRAIDVVVLGEYYAEDMI